MGAEIVAKRCPELDFEQKYVPSASCDADERVEPYEESHKLANQADKVYWGVLSLVEQVLKMIRLRHRAPSLSGN